MHHYQYCKQQARFDQKRFWQIDRFTFDGHGTAYYGEKTFIPVLHVVWTLPDLRFGATEAFQLNDVSVCSPLILLK